MAAVDKTKRIGHWYFGGVASAMAACCTHPLDLLKVRQIQILNDYIVSYDGVVSYFIYCIITNFE